MQIRQANHEDLEACLAIDPSYITDQVWQLAEQGRGEETVLTFRQSHLPRPLRVAYPRTLDDLATPLAEGRCWRVAEEDGQVLGFMDVVAAGWHKTGWIRHLVVEEMHRRRGIATQLLRAAFAWADTQGLQALMAECQTKNYPAISLYRRNGYHFCGYNDRYYTNRDIALFFCTTWRR